MLHGTAKLLIESLAGLSLCLATASGQGLDRFGAAAPGSLDPAAACPTRFDFEVLASAADSGKLLDLSAYRFRGETRYSAARLGGFQRVALRRPELACQGGDVAGMRASAAARRSSQIT
jgi:hypothetical protein